MSEPDWVIESKLARKAGQLEERERIIKLLEEFIENCDLPEVVDRLEWFKDALIKGEK